MLSHCFPSEPLTTLEHASDWLVALYDAGLVFHFDDPPHSIHNQHGRTFTDAQADIVVARLAEFTALADRHGVCVWEHADTVTDWAGSLRGGFFAATGNRE